MMTIKQTWEVLKDTGEQWLTDKVMRLGAALAYYTALSMAPLLVIILAIAGFVFGEEAARGQLVGQIKDLVGQQGAQAIQAMVAHSHQESGGVLATVISVIMLLFGSSGVFGELQDSLNTIWEVQPKPGRAIWEMIRDRFLSFAMVLGIGFLLLVSLVLSTGLEALGSFVGGLAGTWAPVFQVVNFFASLGIFTLLFAMIFKILPDVKIGWKDVWLGAAVTALLFDLGKYLIGLYLGQSSYSSTYGAAGSFVVLLVWVYYSSLILFFGAEFTKVYANKFGSRIVPAENAEPVTEEARAQQGIPRPDGRPINAKQTSETKV
jgi:membrane protein